MNEKNFEYLKKLLANLGFGTRLNGVLQQALEKGFNTFSLGLNNSYLSEESRITGSSHKDIVKYKLNFNKSKTSDSVFMQDCQVLLFKPMEISPRSHTFNLERDFRVTALQAYRLLSGFSLEKNILPHRNEVEQTGGQEDRRKVWIKVDLNVLDAYEQHPLRKFYPEYGYNLGAALDKYPFINLSSGGIREMALQDLAKGKLFKTDMRLFDQVFPVYVAADPEGRSLEVYDKDLVRISDRQIFPDKIDKLDVGTKKNAEIPDVDLSKQKNLPWKEDSDQENVAQIGR